MIKLILDELEADQRAVLGCNISTDSLRNKSSWNLIYNQLLARSHLADRLILEITETHAFGDVFTANEFYHPHVNWDVWLPSTISAAVR
ncbi:hypothetical protein DEA98_25975 [Brucella pseudogrignonensis]|nr:hypothetical protein [Brucella pseudogrignonensis]